MLDEKIVDTWWTSDRAQEERRTEEGTLSIVRHGSTYDGRYATNNPHGTDRQPYACPDSDTLHALLHHCGAEAGAIRQADAALRQGRMTVVLVALSPAQRQGFFCPISASGAEEVL